MNRTSRCVAAGAAALLPLLVATAAGSNWVPVPSPNLGTTNFLQSAAAVSDSDAWAAGYAYTSSRAQLTLLEHWDGASWIRVPSPNPGTAQRCGDRRYTGNSLWGVAAISSTDVWAVGRICTWSTFQTLAEHWDGAAWTVIPSPNQPGADSSVLTSVTAISSNDVWAAGDFEPRGTYIWLTLIEHWNGTNWSIVSSPNPARASNFLNGIAATSPSDVWAVGYTQPKPTYTPEVPLIEHYDGSAWSVVPSVHPAQSLFNELYAVTARSSTDAWAVGYENENSQGQNGTGLIEHWDGTAWTLADSPIAGSATSLTSVTTSALGDAWAAGYITTGNVQFLPVTEHWNGAAWTLDVPTIPGETGQLFGATSASGKVWTVGAFSKSTETSGYLPTPRTLILER